MKEQYKSCDNIKPSVNNNDIKNSVDYENILLVEKDSLSGPPNEILKIKTTKAERKEILNLPEYSSLNSYIIERTGFDLLNDEYLEYKILTIEADSRAFDFQFEEELAIDLGIIYGILPEKIKFVSSNQDKVKDKIELIFVVPESAELRQSEEWVLANFQKILNKENLTSEYEFEIESLFPSKKKCEKEAQKLFNYYFPKVRISIRENVSLVMKHLGSKLDKIVSNHTPRVKVTINIDSHTAYLFGPNNEIYETLNFLQLLEDLFEEKSVKELKCVIPLDTLILEVHQENSKMYWDSLFKEGKKFIKVNYSKEERNAHTLNDKDIKFNEYLENGCPAGRKFFNALKKMGLENIEPSALIKKGVFGWHGTRKLESVENIKRNNLDPTVRQGQAYGKGEYCAVNAGYSQRDNGYWGDTKTLILFFILREDNCYFQENYHYIVDNPTQGDEMYMIPILTAKFDQPASKRKILNVHREVSEIFPLKPIDEKTDSLISMFRDVVVFTNSLKGKRSKFFSAESDYLAIFHFSKDSYLKILQHIKGLRVRLFGNIENNWKVFNIKDDNYPKTKVVQFNIDVSANQEPELRKKRELKEIIFSSTILKNAKSLNILLVFNINDLFSGESIKRLVSNNFVNNFLKLKKLKNFNYILVFDGESNDCESIKLDLKQKLNYILESNSEGINDLLHLIYRDMLCKLDIEDSLLILNENERSFSKTAKILFKINRDPCKHGEYLRDIILEKFSSQFKQLLDFVENIPLRHQGPIYEAVHVLQILENFAQSIGTVEIEGLLKTFTKEKLQGVQEFLKNNSFNINLEYLGEYRKQMIISKYLEKLQGIPDNIYKVMEDLITKQFAIYEKKILSTIKKEDINLEILKKEYVLINNNFREFGIEEKIFKNLVSEFESSEKILENIQLVDKKSVQDFNIVFVEYNHVKRVNLTGKLFILTADNINAFENKFKELNLLFEDFFNVFLLEKIQHYITDFLLQSRIFNLKFLDTNMNEFSLMLSILRENKSSLLDSITDIEAIEAKCYEEIKTLIENLLQYTLLPLYDSENYEETGPFYENIKFFLKLLERIGASCSFGLLVDLASKTQEKIEQLSELFKSCFNEINEDKLETMELRIDQIKSLEWQIDYFSNRDIFSKLQYDFEVSVTSNLLDKWESPLHEGNLWILNYTLSHLSEKWSLISKFDSLREYVESFIKMIESGIRESLESHLNSTFNFSDSSMYDVFRESGHKRTLEDFKFRRKLAETILEINLKLDSFKNINELSKEAQKMKAVDFDDKINEHIDRILDNYQSNNYFFLDKEADQFNILSSLLIDKKKRASIIVFFEVEYKILETKLEILRIELDYPDNNIECENKLNWLFQIDDQLNNLRLQEFRDTMISSLNLKPANNKVSFEILYKSSFEEMKTQIREYQNRLFLRDGLDGIRIIEQEINKLQRNSFKDLKASRDRLLVAIKNISQSFFLKCIESNNYEKLSERFRKINPTSVFDKNILDKLNETLKEYERNERIEFNNNLQKSADVWKLKFIKNLCPISFIERINNVIKKFENQLVNIIKAAKTGIINKWVSNQVLEAVNELTKYFDVLSEIKLEEITYFIGILTTTKRKLVYDSVKDGAHNNIEQMLIWFENTKVTLEPTSNKSDFLSLLMEEVVLEIERKLDALINKSIQVKVTNLNELNHFLVIEDLSSDYKVLFKYITKTQLSLDDNITTKLKELEGTLVNIKETILNLFKNSTESKFKEVIDVFCKCVKEKKHFYFVEKETLKILEDYFKNRLEAFLSNCLTQNKDFSPFELKYKYIFKEFRKLNGTTTNELLKNIFSDFQNSIVDKFSKQGLNKKESSSFKYFLENLFIPIRIFITKIDKRYLDPNPIQNILNRNLNTIEETINSSQRKILNYLEQADFEAFSILIKKKNITFLDDCIEILIKNKVPSNTRIIKSNGYVQEALEKIRAEYEKKIKEAVHLTINYQSKYGNSEEKFKNLEKTLFEAKNFILFFIRVTELLPFDPGFVSNANYTWRVFIVLIDSAWDKFFQLSKINAILEKSGFEMKKEEIYEMDIVHMYVSYYCEQVFSLFSEKVSDMKIRIENVFYELFDDRTLYLTDEKKICDYILKLSTFKENLSLLRNEIHNKIEDFLFEISTNDNLDMALIVKILMTRSGPQGARIIEAYAIFENEKERYFKTLIKYGKIEDILKDAKGTNFDDTCKKKLIIFYNQYKNHYNSIIKEDYVLENFYQKSTVQTDKTFMELTSQFEVGLRKINSWNEKVPFMVGYISAVWVLIRAIEIFEKSKKKDFGCLPEPHGGQIFSLFRMLGLGYTQARGKIPNNLVELKTGEGKSFVLGVASVVLAIEGYEVFCACYSSILSERDKEAFKPLFEKFKVDKKIRYGTFNQLCEDVINKDGNLRENLRNFLLNKKITMIKNAVNPILIIDEVDVLFEDQFSGKGYSLMAPIADESFKNLIKRIWNLNKLKSPDYSNLESWPEFIQLLDNFPTSLHKIIRNHVDQMFIDVKQYYYEHLVENDRIVVLEKDGLKKSNVVKGYKTAFLYLHEYEKKAIKSERGLNEALKFNIKGGIFSYLEIAKSFNCILGVTGTLNLNKNQKVFIEGDKYLNIRDNSYVPSVFGKDTSERRKDEGFVIINGKETYFRLISKKINNTYKNKRSVIVFFETEEKLEAYDVYNKSMCALKTNSIEILTMKTEEKKKTSIITQAGDSQSVTFATKEMGRGIDFLCKDKDVLINGGILVILTFFPEDLSEEIQIQGRCARQGQRGGYCFILNQIELTKFGNIKLNSTYSQLVEIRQKLANEKYLYLLKKVDEIKNKHNSCKNLKSSLIERNVTETIKILEDLNIVDIRSNFSGSKYNTLILIDGTETMDNIINGLKTNLQKIFEDLTRVLVCNRYPVGIISLAIAVYRDYDCGLDGILEFTDMKKSPAELYEFLNKIEARGGDDLPEAVEIGLLHAGRLAVKDGLGQIILIADAPPKELEAIERDRKKNGLKEKWEKKYGKITDWRVLTENLKQFQVKINTVYLLDEKYAKEKYPGAPRTWECAKDLKADFEEISKVTGGVSKFIPEHFFNEGKPDFRDYITEILLSSINKSLGEIFRNETEHSYI